MASETASMASVKNQYLAAVAVNLLLICYGVQIGWPSPNLLLLASDESPIGKITKDEASTIASIQCVGGLISNIFVGYISAKFGRKIALFSMAVPTIVSKMGFLVHFKHLPLHINENINIFPDFMVAHLFCPKRLLFIRRYAVFKSFLW